MDSAVDLTVEIPSYNKMLDHTTFQIVVTSKGESWTVNARYSDLYSLHKKLINVNDSKLPKFPKKRLFGNRSDAFLDVRRSQLQEYIMNVIHGGSAYNTQPLVAFLTNKDSGMF